MTDVLETEEIPAGPLDCKSIENTAELSNIISTKDEDIRRLCQLVNAQKRTMEAMCRCIMSFRQSNETDKKEMDECKEKITLNDSLSYQIDCLKITGKSQKKQILNVMKENEMLKKENSSLREDNDKSHSDLNRYKFELSNVKDKLVSSTNENHKLTLQISGMQKTFYPSNPSLNHVDTCQLQCPMCPERFESSSILDAHLSDAHNIN